MSDHGSITRFYLVNADTNQMVRYLNNGDTIVQETDGVNVNICVETFGSVDSVEMGIRRGSSEVKYPFHATRPFCMASDDNGVTYEPVPELRTPGTFVIWAIPNLWHDFLTGNSGQRTSITITVVEKQVTTPSYPTDPHIKTRRPTPAPTAHPTLSSTTTPVPTPVEMLWQTSQATLDLRLESTPAGKIMHEARSTAQFFQSVTAAHIRQAILLQERVDELLSLDISADILAQESLPDEEEDDVDLMTLNTDTDSAPAIATTALGVVANHGSTRGGGQRQRQRHLQVGGVLLQPRPQEPQLQPPSPAPVATSPLRVRLSVLAEYRSTQRLDKDEDGDGNDSSEAAVLVDWIESAFDSRDERSSYLMQLSSPRIASAAFFAQVQAVQVLRVMEGIVPLPSDGDWNAIGNGEDEDDGGGGADEDGTLSLAVILAMSAGVLVIVLIALLCLWRKHHKAAAAANNYQHQKDPEIAAAGGTTPQNHHKKPAKNQPPSPAGLSCLDDDDTTSNPTLPIQTEILIPTNRPDDISTLGDPSLRGAAAAAALGAQVGREEQPPAESSVESGTTNTLYDYAKIYLSYGGRDDGAGSASEGQGTTQNGPDGGATNLLGPLHDAADGGDASFEQHYQQATTEASSDDPEQNQLKGMAMFRRFDVAAPAGKLGMVLDTVTDLSPIVHLVKPHSVLQGQIQQGDLLLAVDGQDVTRMTLIQVTKLITSKSKQPKRIFSFCRASPSG